MPKFLGHILLSPEADVGDYYTFDGHDVQVVDKTHDRLTLMYTRPVVAFPRELMPNYADYLLHVFYSINANMVSTVARVNHLYLPTEADLFGPFAWARFRDDPLKTDTTFTSWNIDENIQWQRAAKVLSTWCLGNTDSSKGRAYVENGKVEWANDPDEIHGICPVFHVYPA